MKFFSYEKDGGKESRVWGLFIVEIKSLFSIVLLHFKDGSREAYHSHAFNSLSWVLKGKLTEFLYSGRINVYIASRVPIITRRANLHMVKSTGDTWVLSFRGPWAKTWHEVIPGANGGPDRILTLIHGREVISSDCAKGRRANA
jgi:hypothetical protein